MKTNTKRITHYIMALVSIVVLVLLDQITKHLVVLHLKDRSAYVLIKDVFQLEYLENRGAAFGVLQNQRIFFYISVLLITIAVIWFYHKVPIEHKYLPLRICAVLILSGAFGNAFPLWVVTKFDLGYQGVIFELCSRLFILQADQLPDF